MSSSPRPYGIISAPHYLAAEAGEAILREGGNAIEAMVAAAATIAVVYPHMNGIGGDGFWLIHEPGCTPIAIRACGFAAGLASADFYRAAGDDVIPSRGPRAALTVAGAVAGWQAALAVAHRRGTALPLKTLLGEAIRMAKSGVAISRSQAELTRAKWAELSCVPGFAETFAARGLPNTGELQRFPRLAETLSHLSDAGLDDFYRGDLARSMAKDLESLGSPLRFGDLASFQAESVEPLVINLSVGRVYNHPPPTQGVSSLMILGLYDRLRTFADSGFGHAHTIIEATKRAFLWRNAHVTDPRHMTQTPLSVLAPDWLDREASRISLLSAAPWSALAVPGDTVWMGAADRRGCVVSYIQSVYWEFGSGMVLPESGVQWQNRGCSFSLSGGVNPLGPGRYPFHTLNPALAHLNDGRVLAYGTMGGEGQPQTQAAIFTRHVYTGMTMQGAVAAPRWLLGRTWGEDSIKLKIESRMDPEIVKQLQNAGNDVQMVGDFEDMMGHAGMVCRHADGCFEAANDPRSDGLT